MNWRLVMVVGFVVAVGVWREWTVEHPGARRPQPNMSAPAPERGDIRGPLPDISASDPEVSVGLGPKNDSIGTAFALSESGWWMTARHVVDQCVQIQLRFPYHRSAAVGRVLLHPRADVALLSTQRAGAPLSIAQQPLFIGQNGFQVGYPHGVPGEVWSTLLGRRRMRVNGRYRTDEPVVAWVERSRRPGHLQTLGGLSGGPALNAAGQLVGLLVAESRRRGRLYTAAPASLKQMPIAELGEVGVGSAMSIKPQSLSAQAEVLRRAPSVALVVCLAARRAGQRG